MLDFLQGTLCVVVGYRECTEVFHTAGAPSFMLMEPTDLNMLLAKGLESGYISLQ